jgi:hypothetical protein
MARLRVFGMVALLAAAPAFAQVSSISTSNPASKGQDPNRMVCEVEQTTGTRLGARKVCKTAAEWAQMKREHRETLEKVQQQATSTGIPSG